MPTKPARILDEGFVTFVEDLRGIVWNSSGKGKVGWGTLAQDARLCVATVSKFAAGETKIPVGNTIFMLTRACGYRLALIQADAPQSFGEVTPGKYRDAVPRTKRGIVPKKALRQKTARRA